MDTITISSSDSIKEPSKEILVPLSKANLKAGTANWEHSHNSCDRQESNCTPCTFQKINRWINSIEIGYVESNDSEIRQDSVYSGTDMQGNGLDIDGNMLTKMYKNCENYTKFQLDKLQTKKGQLDNFCIEEYNYGDSNISRTNKEDSNKVYTSDVYKTLSNYRSIKHNNDIDNYKVLKREIQKSDAYESDVPLSPESEKKKELCSYLQLMKPSDKKTVMILQNRRSVRVKNLSLIQERKELEKKLKEEHKNAESSEQDAYTNGLPEIEPFNVVNGNVDKKKHKWLKYNGSRNLEFNFPKPPSFLTKTISDFDSVATEFLDSVPQTNQLNYCTYEEEEPSFVMPKLHQSIVSKRCDFDIVMEKNSQLLHSTILPHSVESQNDTGKEDLIEKNTINEDKKRSEYRRRKLSRKKIMAPRRIPKRITRSQLITHFIHSLRNRNIGRSALKKYQKLKRRRQQNNIKVKSKEANEIEECLNSTENIIRQEDINDSTRFITREDTNELYSFIPDIDFNSLSNEHQQSLLLNAHTANNIIPRPLVSFYSINSPKTALFDEKKSPEKEKVTFFSGSLNVQKSPREVKPHFNGVANNIDNEKKLNAQSITVNIDLKSPSHTDNEDHQILDPAMISSHEEQKPIPITEVKKDVTPKSLHRCLNSSLKKNFGNSLEHYGSPSSWNGESFSNKMKKNRHSINISPEHGHILKAFYLDYNLILCQEFMVSFWTQTALGNVLGAQNMWIHKGSIQRMATNNNCIFKESLEMVVSTEHNVAYVELWTKEHQSDVREGPVADVFATVYFWKTGQNGLDKKVLQLENINGFADDVQYSVLKTSAKIIVSWHIACNELENKKTYVHCYQLAPDYQTVYSISEFESVEHYVSSLHSIEDCENVIAGCGENKITLWNIDYGYVVATIEMTEIKSPLCTLWVKCDRGFLFTLQQCVDRELRLIAIHGMNHSWKKLASYIPPEEYDRLKGVCVENGIIIAFYDQGILCWNAQTAETIIEEASSEAEYISGRYVINVINNQVNIRHAFTHLLYSEDS